MDIQRGRNLPLRAHSSGRVRTADQDFPCCSGACALQKPSAPRPRHRERDRRSGRIAREPREYRPFAARELNDPSPVSSPLSAPESGGDPPNVGPSSRHRRRTSDECPSNPAGPARSRGASSGFWFVVGGQLAGEQSVLDGSPRVGIAEAIIHRIKETLTLLKAVELLG